MNTPRKSRERFEERGIRGKDSGLDPSQRPAEYFRKLGFLT